MVDVKTALVHMMPSAARVRRRVESSSQDNIELESSVAIAASVAALRLPPQTLLQRMKDKPHFVLGKSAGNDGRLEQVQLLALPPDVLWNTMQQYNELRIIVASLLMGFSLTLLLLTAHESCGEWPASTCYWLSCVADWLSFLCLFMMFLQIFVSMTSSRIYATVPPHRIHEFVADCTALEPRPFLNQEGFLNLGMFVMFVAAGFRMLLKHPGPQGIVECVLISVMPFVFVLYIARDLSWQTRSLFGLAWGHQPGSSAKREATLARIKKYAAELADDIDAVTSKLQEEERER